MAIAKTKIIQSLIKLNAEEMDDAKYEGAMMLAAEILGVSVDEVSDMIYDGVDETEEIDNMFLWNRLLEHIGHEVEIAYYGDPKNPVNITLEDLDTNEVILDAEIYTLHARED